MQLWKKNFLVTFLMFLLVINGSLFILHAFLFRSELNLWMNQTVSREQGVFYLITRDPDKADGQLKKDISITVREHISTGVKIRVELDGKKVINYIPSVVKGDDSVQIVRYRNIPYVLINDKGEVGENRIDISYMESMASFSQNQSRRTRLMLLTGIILSAVIGTMLYLTMKRINRPVSQIAHELRTPLTGIQGYAEYLMMGNIGEEDRFFAAQQIVASSRNLRNIVERLLVMGGMREGRVQMQKVDLREVLKEIQALYPGIDVDCRIESIQGDKTLIRCMLENLIHNAVTCGSHVKVSAYSGRIIIWNDGEAIEEKKLKKMNRPQGLSAEYADRHGFGIGLCHEIAGVHGWKLGYKSSQKEGTTAEIGV